MRDETADELLGSNHYANLICYQFLIDYRRSQIFELRHTVTLSGSLVTTEWRALRLRMEETAYRYGGYQSLTDDKGGSSSLGIEVIT
jgi:hypothetical protein